MTGADGKANVTHREMLLVFDEVLREVKDELKGQGRENKFIGARVRLSRFAFSSGVPIPADHLFDHQIYYTRGIKVVYRRLYCSQKGVSSFDCWCVVSDSRPLLAKSSVRF